MSGRVEALANADVLRWARERRGIAIEDAAEKIGVSEERLAAVEAGKERLSFAQLRAAARVYKRAVVVFYLAEVPDEQPPVADFRRLAEAEDREWSPELRLAVRRVSYKRDIAVRLAQFAARYDWRYVDSIDVSNEVEKVAAMIRKSLPVPFIERGADEFEIFREWRSAVESRGTLVFLEAVSKPVAKKRSRLDHLRAPSGAGGAFVIYSLRWSV